MRPPSSANPKCPAITDLQRQIFQSLSSVSTLQALSTAPGSISDMNSLVHSECPVPFIQHDSYPSQEKYPAISSTQEELGLRSTEKRILESEKDALLEKYISPSLDGMDAERPGEETNSKKSKRKKNYKRHAKPPYTYVAMIALVIQNSLEKKLKLTKILEDLAAFFPFFRGDYKGWKDSVRHTLSNNDYFQKVLKNPGKPNLKGNFWTVDVTRIPLDLLKQQNTASVRKSNFQFVLDLAPYILQGFTYPCEDGMHENQVLQSSPPISRIQWTELPLDNNMAKSNYPSMIDSLLSRLPVTGHLGKLPAPDTLLPWMESHVHETSLSGRLPALDSPLPSMESCVHETRLPEKLPAPDNPLPRREFCLHETGFSGRLTAPDNPLSCKESRPHVRNGYSLLMDSFQFMSCQYGHPLSSLSTNGHTLNPNESQTSLRPPSVPLRPPGTPTASSSLINLQTFSSSFSMPTISLSSVSDDEEDCGTQPSQTEVRRGKAKRIRTHDTPDHADRYSGSSSDSEDARVAPETASPRQTSQQPWELPTSYTKFVPPNIVAPPSRHPLFPFASIPLYSYTPVSCAGPPYWGLMAFSPSSIQPGHPHQLAINLENMLQMVPPNKTVYDVGKNHPDDVIPPAFLYQQCISNAANANVQSLYSLYPN